MTLRPIFIILVDISGYTKFIRYHKTSLLHAEKIVAELMEAVLAKVEVPIVAHEILGDAISLYAIDEGIPGQPDTIYQQLQKYFEAFWNREASLISACNLCECDACRQVGRLKLKAVLHAGEAAFTKVLQADKISGEDVIIAHRLLKNSVPSNEYILMTDAFVQRCDSLDLTMLVPCIETCDDIGQVQAYYCNLDKTGPPPLVSLQSKLADFFRIEGYMIRRWFREGKYQYRNLPLSPVE